jgi:hypothetical protein
MGLFSNLKCFKGIKMFLIIASRPAPFPTSGMVWFGQKMFFLIFVI